MIIDIWYVIKKVKKYKWANKKVINIKNRFSFSPFIKAKFWEINNKKNFQKR